MQTGTGNRDDQYYEELLGAAAFGTLTQEEEAELSAYLKTSESARAELAELRAMAGDLSLLVDEMEPSAGLRDRVEQAVLADVAWAQPTIPASTAPGVDDDIVALKTDRIAPSRSIGMPTPIWNRFVWAAAAALLIGVLSGVVIDRVFFQEEETPLDNRQTIAFELALATPAPDLAAELTYDPDEQLFVLETENMPAAPEDHVYQVWLIDEAGVPLPKGVMDDATFAVHGDRDQYAAFAVTVEPAPLGSEGPTTDPILVAPLTPAEES